MPSVFQKVLGIEITGMTVSQHQIIGFHISGRFTQNQSIGIQSLQKLNIFGKEKIGAYKIAGDLNDKSGITITDLSQMRKNLSSNN